MTIKQVQFLLSFLEEFDPGPIDGIWGEQTHRALKAFQRAYGIPADGYPGPVTDKALRHAVCYGMPERDPEYEDAPEETQEENETVQDGSYDGAKYLQADGYYHIPRGVDCQLTKNFRASEIHCQGHGCCTESVISKRIMDLAQEIRDDIGKPLAIGSAGGSGYRCPKHNADPDVKGSANSLHMLSEAVDLHYASPSALKSVVLRHLKDGEIGIYSWGCHVGAWDRGYINEFIGGN